MGLCPKERTIIRISHEEYPYRDYESKEFLQDGGELNTKHPPNVRAWEDVNYSHSSVTGCHDHFFLMILDPWFCVTNFRWFYLSGRLAILIIPILNDFRPMPLRFRLSPNLPFSVARLSLSSFRTLDPWLCVTGFYQLCFFRSATLLSRVV